MENKDKIEKECETIVELFWREELVPKDMRIRQVYGVPFDDEGRVLLKVENFNGKKIFSLAGGTVEKFDKDMVATLYREFKEEVNTSLHSPVYLGYQEVRGDGDREPYAQVRMACRINQSGEKLPDPDNGKVYDRVLVSPEKAKRLISWGEIGNKILDKAKQVAENEYRLKVDNSDDEKWV